MLSDCKGRHLNGTFMAVLWYGAIGTAGLEERGVNVSYPTLYRLSTTVCAGGEKHLHWCGRLGFSSSGKGG